MAYQVDAPEIDQATGQVIGEPTVVHRDLDRYQLSQTYIDEDYNTSIEAKYAEQALSADLPIFNDNASDADLVNFWTNDQPLTEAEISAITAAYVASDNEDIAMLLEYKLGVRDASDLPEDIQEALFGQVIDDEGEVNDVEEDVDIEELTQAIINDATEPNPEIADAVLSVDIGDSDAAAAVQYLTYKYYQGEMSLEDVFAEAFSSGINKNELALAFDHLKTALN